MYIIEGQNLKRRNDGVQCLGLKQSKRIVRRRSDNFMIDAVLSTMENEEQRSELATFYSKYKERFCWIASSRLKNPRDAEDAVQEVFSEIADKPEKFFDLPPVDRLAYIDVMVRNISVDMFNAKNEVQIEELDEEIEDMTISLENSLLDKISHDEILSFMKQLPTPQKTILLLHCYLGLTIFEASQRLNIPLTAANKRLTVARKAVRKFIEERNAKYE